jgi:hypothetical protein
MVAPLGPWRGTLVVRQPSAMSREVWRRDGVCPICECGRRWVLHSCGVGLLPTVVRATCDGCVWLRRSVCLPT